MKKLLIALPILVIIVIVAAALTTPKANTSTIEVDVPLETLQK